MAESVSGLFDRALLGFAIGASLRKLDPRDQLRNPVMFVAYIGAILFRISFVAGWIQGNWSGFDFQISLWLWFTVLFANFAESMAEGRGKAQADSLKRARSETFARLLKAGREERIAATLLRKGDTVVCESGDVKGHATRAGISIEMAAREMRHEFLGRVARQLKIRTIALAHHADDQVELFFLRALRGAGGEGLGGMKWRSPSPGMVGSSALKRPGQHLKGVLRAQLVRPLLDISKTKLRVIACKHHIHFREDASNASSDLQRNRIRHELLPLLRRRFQPALDKTILRAMEIVRAEAEVVT